MSIGYGDDPVRGCVPAGECGELNRVLTGCQIGYAAAAALPVAAMAVGVVGADPDALTDLDRRIA